MSVARPLAIRTRAGCCCVGFTHRLPVAGRVHIHIHKELMLDTMQRNHPARHYVMVLRLLTP
jgi:hypothetical protein